jgi:uncharacterized membrane protein
MRNWSAVASQPARMHLVAGGAVACLLLWLMNIHLVDGLVLHFLGVTTLTLVVGWSFTVLAATLACWGFLPCRVWSGRRSRCPPACR